MTSDHDIDLTTQPVVPHPRYGVESVGKPARAEKTETSVCVWVAGVGEVIYPQSVLPADPSKFKRHGAFPPTHYVDVLRRCRDCGRVFVFFAREQQQRYEEQGQFAGVGGHHCHECKAASEALTKHRRAYARYVAEPPVELYKLLEFLEAADALWAEGEMTNHDQIRRAYEIACDEAPTADVTKRLREIVRALP